MGAPLLRKHLDEAARCGCEAPRCADPHDRLTLSARCHPAKGVRLDFSYQDSVLVLRCAICEKPVAGRIAVERHEPQEALSLGPQCHPGRGVDLEYKDGVFSTRCAVCEKPVGRIVVEQHDEEAVA